ncbi:MAG TPA: NAD-dependent epimerase/dehydratase family protein [Solirubrobacteraceae bacterium]|nr:NAD-dependent epimerase/dehydratase family protein [Solirubrobacteraceae bacterium]
MRALVTGGAGFIGSNLVDALAEAGAAVTVVDTLVTGRRENVRAGATLAEVDVADAQALDAVVAATAPEVVFHLAAQVDVRRSVADPARDLIVNVAGTINVLEAARRHGPGHVVLASTGGAIYGEAERVPTPEAAPARPPAPYGASKLAAEHYCRLYADLHGVPVTALRFANVYGPRQDPLGEGGVVAIFCRRAADAGTAVIFGDGRQTRDFVHVGDVVDALLAAVGAGFGPFNIGTGHETSVLELAERLGVATRHEPERAGEVRRSCLDPSRAARDLGWVPRIPLADGLERTLEWVRAGQP